MHLLHFKINGNVKLQKYKLLPKSFGIVQQTIVVKRKNIWRFSLSKKNHTHVGNR